MSIKLTWAELKAGWPDEYERQRGGRPTPAVEPSRLGKPTVNVGGRTYHLLRPQEPGETGPWSFTIPGWLPANLNKYLRSHWSKVSKAKKATSDAVLAACIADSVPRATGRRRVSIRLTLPKARRPPDHDNLLKSLYDALTDAGAIVDDSIEWCETGSFETEVGRLATTVTLDEVSA